MNIVLCDDNRQELEIIREALEEILAGQKRSAAVETVQSSQELLFDIEDGKLADIYILDVEMPEPDGLHLAEAIRARSEQPVILFLTAYLNRAAESYSVSALDFIAKPNLRVALPRALDRAFQKIFAAKDAPVTLRGRGESRRVYLSEIVLAKSAGHITEVNLRQGSFVVSRRIHELFDELRDERFLFIDRGCFLNLDYVRSVGAANAELTTGQKVPVSRRARSKLLLAINRHL